QVERSVREGGADVDWLAFDLENDRLIEPQGHDQIVQELMQGKFRYLPPSGEGHRSDSDRFKQTTRGFRPFIELPFLSLVDEQQLRNEIQEMRAELPRSKNQLSKAVEQFHKMIRNNRFSGGNNRFYRSSKDSIESDILELSKEIRKQLNLP